MNGSAHYPQHCCRNRVAHSALVLGGGDIQTIMQTVLNAPILADQFQQSGRIGFVGTQAGDHPDGLRFFFTAGQDSNSIHPRQLHHMGKAQLSGRDQQHLDATPFNATVPALDLQELRGKNLPGGSVALGPEGRPGCL